MKALISLFLLSFIAFSAMAAKYEPSSHGHDWPQIIDPLLRSGFTRFGSLNLAKFRDQAARVKWWKLSSPPTSSQSGSRESAYNTKGGFEVFIVEDLRPEVAAYLPELELHEAMGAVGVNDDDYQKSTALNLLSKMPAGKERDALAARYTTTLFQMADRAGGDGGSGTGVTGGGDFPAVAMKNAVLERLMGDYRNRLGASRDFLALYPRIKFEPLTKGRAKVVTLKYSYVFKPAVHEDLAVYVPLKRWQEGPGAQDDLIRDAAEKISAIFPAREGATRTFRPSACPRADQLVTYPATRDADVAAIQDYRGSVSLGCKKYIPGMDSRSLTTSHEPSIVDPRSSGMVYFACRFSYRGQHFDGTTKLPVGGRGLAEIAWSIDEGDYLGGDVISTPQGTMESTLISYKSPSGVHAPIKFDKSPDGEKSESRLMVKGFPLTFSCHRSSHE